MNISKRKSMFKMLGMVAVLISSIAISGCSCFAPKSKEFSTDNNELKITLTENFEQSGSLESSGGLTTGLKFTSKDNTALVQIFKWKSSSFDGFIKPNLTELAKITSSKNINYDKDNKLCYTDEYTENNIYIKTFLFKTTSAYYEVDFRYVESGDDRIYDWAKSIKFADDLVYDIDESMTDTKTIILDTQDSASMKIGTSYIKLEDEDNIYQKVIVTGQNFVTECEITVDAKEDSSYNSLSAYAASKEYTNRNLTSKNYISLTTTSYVIGYGNCDVIVYCFESENNYYTVEFLSNNADIDMYDSYADTFSAN